MKKQIIHSLIALCLLCNQPLSASNKKEQLQQNETERLEGKQTDTPFQEIRLEEAQASEPRSESNLQNWLFAAGSIVSATVAILVVGWSQGTSPSNN